MGLWITFLGVDEAREENRVTDEEDGRVVADDIPDTVIGVELDGESTRIASSVSTATFST